MGCSWSYSKGRGTVKVHPFSVGGKQPLLNTKRVSKGIHEEPSSSQQQNQELLDTLWKIVDYRTTVDSIPTDKAPRIAKTVHLYVASIFKDFVEEREFLSSRVFPELSHWCSNRNVHFVPVDLRRGLTHAPDTVQFTATCLQEINRLMEDGIPVCFLALLSEQVGYIPSPDLMTNLMSHSCSKWIDGMSLLEMEIVKAAFFTHNPNALFLCRDASCLSKLPRDIGDKYKSSSAFERARMDLLKAKLQGKYPEQVYTYTADTKYSPVTGDVKFGGFENFVSKIVLEFFFLRIKSEFLTDPVPLLTPLECIDYQQKRDLEKRTKVALIGKQQLVDKIKLYIESPSSNSPLLILGDSGSGKTTVLAHVAMYYQEKYKIARKEQQLRQLELAAERRQPKDESTTKRRFSVIGNLLQQKNSDFFNSSQGTVREANTVIRRRMRRISDSSQPQNFIHVTSALRSHRTQLEAQNVASGIAVFGPQPSVETSRTDREWQVFYHMVGPSALSYELRYILQRLWRVDGLGEPRMSESPRDCNALANKIREMLSTRGQKQFVLFLDNIDKIKGEYPSNVLKWIPSRLPPNVRIIISLHSGAEVRKVLTSREPKCTELTNGSPSLVQSKLLLKSSLQQHNIREGSELMEVLLNKHGIGNPLYISELCGELARQGDTLGTDSERVLEKAKVLPNDLPSLYSHLLSAIEESSGKMGIAMLCLLYCSRCGLTEVELLEMLGTLEDPTEQGDCKGDANLMTTESAMVGSQRFNTSDTGSWSVSDVERFSLCESNISSSVIRSRKASMELHLPLQGSALPGSTRLSPRPNQRKISSCSSSGSAPEHVHSHPHSHSHSHSHSPLLLPATPDFSKFGVTPPGSLKRHLSRPSPSLTPVSSHLSPISPSKQLIIDLLTGEEELPPAEIEEVNRETRQKSAKLSHRLYSSTTKLTKRISSLRWATLYQTLRPYVKNVGGLHEIRWVLSNEAFAKAIYNKYFKNPPTSSFPFAFSTSFCGAKEDNSQQHLKKKKSTDPSQQSDTSPSDLILKRVQWWHARLCWYFQSYCTDVSRRAEELPHHLVQLQHTSKLTKCLSSLDVFHHLSSPQRVMDLQYYWHCAGGDSAFVFAYSQMLASLEIDGASAQELVKSMKQVALFYQKTGAGDSARQLLSDAVDVVESRLGGRRDLMADLMYHLVISLSEALTQQMDISAPQTLMEPEYRLLKTGGKTAEILRSLDTPASMEQLASLLLTLSRHLNYYASQGGSAELPSRHALEQAREAADESANLFMSLRRPAKALEAVLTLATTHSRDTHQQFEVLKRAENVCLKSFGYINVIMLDILHKIAELLEQEGENDVSYSEYVEKRHNLDLLLFGGENEQTGETKEKGNEISGENS